MGTGVLRDLIGNPVEIGSGPAAVTLTRQTMGAAPLETIMATVRATPGGKAFQKVEGSQKTCLCCLCKTPRGWCVLLHIPGMKTVSLYPIGYRVF